MQVIIPEPIVEAQLTYTNVAEPGPGEVVYSAATEYLLDDEVIELSTHRKFASLQGVTGTVTISNGTPAVITWAEHGRISGEPIKFSTTGTLPTGLVAGTTYYWLSTGSDTGNVAATAGGTAINTTTAGSGTHTAKVSANLAKPLPVAPEEETLWWKQIGMTNRYAVFDLYRNTSTISPSPVTYKITTGQRTGSGAALGIVADFITITVRRAGEVVYTVTKDLSRRAAIDPLSYFFGRFDTDPSYVVTDLPLDGSVEIEFTLTRDSGDVEVSTLMAGTAVYLGRIQYGAESSIENFSETIRDKFGAAQYIPSTTVPRTKQEVRSAKSITGTLYDLRRQLNSVPCLWLGMDDGLDEYFEPLSILGPYTQFLINVEHPDETRTTLELEEI